MANRHFTHGKQALCFHLCGYVLLWTVGEARFLPVFCVPLQPISTEMEFKIKEYGRTELALAYSPDIAPESAWKKFKRWVDRYPGLNDRLREQGYNPRSSSFTPRQVAIIVECLGEPYE